MDERTPDTVKDSGQPPLPEIGRLTAREAALALGVHERTIRRAIARGDLVATKQAGVFRITPAALAGYQAHRSLPAPTPWPGRLTPPQLVPLTSPVSDRSSLLPQALTPLIGREVEVADAAAILLRSDVRLLTLTGPGGIGKTRLGWRVAEEVRESFPDGVWFVPLTAVRDPALVARAVVGALGIPDIGRRPADEGLRAFLRDRRALLLLDNFEQVLDAAPLVAGLLSTCPALKVIVTSRTLLAISGEHTFAVPQLALPDPASLPDLLDMTRIEAVALFLYHARAVDPSFALTAEHAVAVAELCVRLDGIPLAIELAAARTRLLSPQHLLARSTNRLRLLIGGPRDQPARLRTMRDAIAWSYDLLTPDEQELFRRLSVFVGGFTGIAAAAVAFALDDAETDALERIGTLAGHSLVRREERPRAGFEPVFLDETDGPRFGMLETIREFGLEQLAESGEEGLIRQRHAAYYLCLAEQIEPHVAGNDPAPGSWLDLLEQDHGNLRAALTWAERTGDVETSLRLGAALAWFWHSRGYLTEGRGWLARALGKGAGTPGSIRAKAVGRAAWLAILQDDVPGCRCLVEEGLALLQHLDDPDSVANLLFLKGMTLHRHPERQRRLQVAGEVTRLMEEALVLYRSLGDRGEEGSTLVYLGTVAHDLGHFARARVFYEQGHALVSDPRVPAHMGLALSCLGYLARDQGERGQATRYWRESLALWWESGILTGIPACLFGLAEASATGGHPARAVRLFGAAESAAKALGGSGFLAWITPASFAPAMAIVQARLDAETYATAFAAGQSLLLADAVAEAMAAPNLDEDDALPANRRLTSREREVLRQLIAGRTDREIAAALFVSLRTVNSHVAHILAKLDVASRAEAAAYAITNRIV
jgi:non-specific serine/threonine protein kinase